MAVGGLNRAQRAVRLTLVLGVLAVELWFLVFVYHLDDRVDAQEVACTRALTAIGVVTGPTLERDLAPLLRSGAPGVARVDVLHRRWLVSHDDADLVGLDRAVRSTSRAIAAEQHRTDREVLLLLAGMFLVVCAGWFTWFARLARRHRAVQQQLTEKQAVDAGQRRLTALVHNSADVVMTLDGDSTATFASDASSAVLGLAPTELVGRRLLDLVLADDRSAFVRLLTGTRGGEHTVCLRMTHADGRELVVEGTLRDLRHDTAVACWVLTVRDVTERARLEEALTHQAFHDSLTGLANRQLFSDRLGHALHRPGTGALSLLFIDLDDFKLVNDGLGHGVGDLLLVEVAGRISGVLREHDTAARLGGDEFAVLLEDTDEPTATTVAGQLLAALNEPLVLQGVTHSVRASIGVATTAAGAATGAELMSNADSAMYLAKERGKGSVAVFDPSLHTRTMEQLSLRIELREALASDQLVLHYQPTIDMTTQLITGFEALVRWQHPDRGLLPPSEFIGVAEQAGLIVPLGAWVLTEACLAGAALQSGDHRPSMSVNVAAQQLTDPHFADVVLAALAAAGLPPEQLVLEITETALLADVEVGVAALSRLRVHGIRVAIDDFGTGYSSLSHLSRLPVDVLKVDKSFIDRLGGDDGDTSLVEAIITMAAALNLVTVAEGVELVEQARWLHTHGSPQGQGFLWSKPVGLESAKVLLRSGLPEVLGPAGLRLVPRPDAVRLAE